MFDFLTTSYPAKKGNVSIKKERPSKKEAFLKKALLEAQRSLQDAYDGLSNVKEPELIDSYIYELNAANLRYQVILRDYKTLKNGNYLH